MQHHIWKERQTKMMILACILIVTGLVLLVVGRNVTRYLPPDYQNEDDGFRQLLQTMGNLIKGVGIVLLLAGVVCLIIN